MGNRKRRDDSGKRERDVRREEEVDIKTIYTTFEQPRNKILLLLLHKYYYYTNTINGTAWHKSSGEDTIIQIVLMAPVMQSLA